MALAGCGGQTVPEHEHKWDEGTVTVAPSCHATGTKTYKCTVPNCQQTMLETLAMTPHKWNAGTITKPSTCSEPGEQTFACENEGCEATKVIALPKGEHHYEETGLTRVPDLFEDGEMGYRCHDCGHESGETVHARADFGEQFFSENWAIGHLDTFDPSDTFLAPTLVPFVAEKNAYENEHVKVTKDTIDIDSGALIIGYRVQTDAENSINVAASFSGVEATDKLASFVVVLDKDGDVKSVVAAAELSASWEYNHEAVVDVANEDVLAMVYNGGTDPITFTGALSLCVLPFIIPDAHTRPFRNARHNKWAGIILPGEAKEKPQQAEVVAVGPGGVVDGKEIKMQVKAGETVIYSKYSGTDVEIDDEKYVIVKQNDILAIVK